MSHSAARRDLFSMSNPLQWLLMAFWAVAMMVGGAANASVAVRVDADQDPIKSFVTVTDATTGLPIAGLNASNFTVFVDGVAISSPPSVDLPPEQDSAKRVSVVFAMDFSQSVQTAALAPMQNAVIAFINAMKPGDYAAIVKFNFTNPSKASVVQPFTLIDPAGKSALAGAVMAPYPGEGTNLYDAIVKSTQEFTAAAGTLPSGPKAIIVIGDGGEGSSTNTVNAALAAANGQNLSIFTVGVGEFATTSGQQRLTQIAAQASGEFYAAPNDTEITNAYTDIKKRLSNEYQLSFSSTISPTPPCDPHTIKVQVGSQESVVESFTRCTPSLTTVPQLAGKTQAEASTALATASLTLGTVTTRSSSTVAAGKVISHTPIAGSVVNTTTAVNIVISTGASAPDVVGLTQAAASTAIANAGLVVGSVTQQTSSNVSVGFVISQTPPAGTSVVAGSSVNLVVSTGPQMVAAPNVVGSTQGAATTSITGAGLVLGTVTQQSSSTVASGSVISQTPAAGTSVAVGSTVTLVVSNGPPPASNGGGGGGGGATGPFEILFGVGLLAMARRRRMV